MTGGGFTTECLTTTAPCDCGGDVAIVDGEVTLDGGEETTGGDDEMIDCEGEAIIGGDETTGDETDCGEKVLIGGGEETIGGCGIDCKVDNVGGIDSG